MVAAAVLAGCGSSGDKTPALTSGQAQALVAQLEAARATAAAGDLAGTQSAITKFRRSVARLQRDGALSANAARALRTGAVRALARVKSDVAPPQPAPTTTMQTTPAPAPLPPGKGNKHKKHDKGHGKKHGQEGD
ncbi:MAG: hypothetical protein QOJ29_1994 [Thermoleophilaceae bacterium]|jgi:hypothetical protein|nr:hypothetical protein [Thermoleophilaceae bacterium]